MGLEIFLFHTNADEKAVLDKSAVHDILSRDALDPDNLSFVEYPDGGGAGEVWGIDDEEITSLTFAHFGGRTFLSRVLELADRFDGLLYWTVSGIYCGVTKASLIATLPDRFKDFEEVALIKDVDHFGALLGGWKLEPMTYIRCG